MKFSHPLLVVGLVILSLPPLQVESQADPVPSLILQLKACFWKTRYAAIEQLKEYLPDRRVVDALISAFDDRAWQVRNEASSVFWHHTDPDLIRTLLKALISPSAKVRKYAARALNFVKPDLAIIKILTLALDDGDSEVMSEVFLSLTNIMLYIEWDTDHFGSTKKNKSNRKLALQAFSALGNKLLDPDIITKIIGKEGRYAEAVFQISFAARRIGCPFRSQVQRDLQVAYSYWKANWRTLRISRKRFDERVKRHFEEALNKFNLLPSHSGLMGV